VIPHGRKQWSPAMLDRLRTMAGKRTSGDCGIAKGFSVRHSHRRTCFAPAPMAAFPQMTSEPAARHENRRKTPSGKTESTTKPSWTLTGQNSRLWGGITTSTTKSSSLFRPNCIANKVVSPLRKGEIVEVQGMAPEHACSAEMLVRIR
jgi:hypothetical protein